MKKHIFLIFTLILLITTSLSIAKGSSVPNNYNNLSIDEVNESEKFNELVKLLNEVSDLYEDYGPGLHISAGMEALKNWNEGNCSQEAYIFAREASLLGYKTNIVRLFHKSGLNHVLVNVYIGDKPFLFDPSNGVYYDYGVYSILEDPNLVKKINGVPEKFSKVYTTKYFFSGIENINIYPNFNYAEPNLLANFDTYNVISKDLFHYPYNIEGGLDNDKETYVAGKDPLPNAITIEFKKPIDFYRIYLGWYNNTDYPTEFSIYYGNDLNKLKLLTQEKNYQNDLYFELIKKQSINAKYIKFVFNKTNGQQRVLLDTIGIYK